MLKQIGYEHLPVGRIITRFHADGESIYIVFEDATFVAFRARPIYDQVILEDVTINLDPARGLCGYDVEACVELGIITQKEYDDALSKQNEMYAQRNQECWQKEYDRLAKLLGK